VKSLILWREEAEGCFCSERPVMMRLVRRLFSCGGRRGRPVPVFWRRLTGLLERPRKWKCDS